mmetsp:Transcript_30717/g.66195  ORF Transcript_30717/g.66195 Transcript_30717/m.66195 type:complete len:103 (-) Transcript_30717:585-893(-)
MGVGISGFIFFKCIHIAVDDWIPEVSLCFDLDTCCKCDRRMSRQICMWRLSGEAVEAMLKVQGLLHLQPRWGNKTATFCRSLACLLTARAATADQRMTLQLR